MFQPLGYVQNTSLSSAVAVAKGVSCAKSAVPAAGGSGYLVGDLLALSGGTKVTAAQFVVTAVGPVGEVTNVSLRNDKNARPYCGFYTSKPSNAVSTTTTNSAGGTGTGTGCTLTVTWADDQPPPGTKQVLVQAEAQALRWRDDGVAPTSSIGTKIAVGDTLLYDFDAANLKLIETTASGTANITFYGN